MNELFDKSTYELLDRLGRLFVMRRGTIKKEIEDDLNRALEIHRGVENEFESVVAENERLNTRVHDERERRLQEQAECRQENSVLCGRLEVAQGQLGEVINEKEDWKGKCVEWQEDYERLNEKYNLVNSLVSAQPIENEGVERFKWLLRNDFLEFANEESSLSNEADAVLSLQQISEELELVAGFPAIHGKNIVAVAGAFSSGKSEFVNSFIGESEIRLAVGIEPVTSIPTYVTGTTVYGVRAFTSRGGQVEIGSSGYSIMSYEFGQDMNFDVKTLVPYVLVGIGMDAELFRYICLIDTPGYNPGDASGSSRQDKGMALKHASQADGLIWVISIDANGTVSKTDLEFLHELGVERQEELYVVVNKADLRSDDEIDDILDEIEDVMDCEGISYAGISAYSSLRREEYGYRCKSLEEWLRSINVESEIKGRMISKAKKVMDWYRRALDNDIEEGSDVKNKLRSLGLDAFQTGDEDLYRKMRERIVELKGYLVDDDLHSYRERLNDIETKMICAIEKAVDEAMEGI